jgi:hypothetical protein
LLQKKKNLKKNIAAKGGKIYMLTPQEKNRYLKDAAALTFSVIDLIIGF